MMVELPPRGAVFLGRAMMLSSDVDCGELIPAHHFVARGLGGPFRAATRDRWSGDDPEDQQLMAEFEEAGGYPALTLEYELVPGVTAAEAAGEGGFFRYPDVCEMCRSVVATRRDAAPSALGAPAPLYLGRWHPTRNGTGYAPPGVSGGI
jgi:hypothetical protein